MRARLTFPLAAMLVAASALSPAAQTCKLSAAPGALPENTTLFTNAQQTVAVYRAIVRRDDDGAPNAYHPCGANYSDPVCKAGFGLDHICSGVTVHDANNKYVPPREKNPKTGKPTSKRCLDTFRAAEATEFPMCGAGKACVTGWPGITLIPRDPSAAGFMPQIPMVQKDGPYQGYYVSQTTLQRPDKTKPGGISYIDARKIPFIVVPGSSVLTGHWGFGSSTRPDIALVLATRSDGATRGVFAVVADTGPVAQIGEGSPALLGRLRGVSAEELNSERPAASPIPGGKFSQKATYVLFKGSSQFLSSVWPERDLTASDIVVAGNRALTAAGGLAMLAGCTGVPANVGSVTLVQP